MNSTTSAGSTAASDAPQAQAQAAVPGSTGSTVPATPDTSAQQEAPNLTLSSSAETSGAASTASKAKKSFRWTRKRESTANSSTSNSAKDGSAGASLPVGSAAQESSDASGGHGQGDATSAASSSP